ncbi:MAG: methyltransferase domain-containing protein [Comamonadaceae bacterium]|nr:methyltransferase domain-containing protein [Comamonadaceae bacterium]
MAHPPAPLHVYDRDIQSSERTSLSVLSAHLPPGARVLDLGCGSGAVGRYLARRGDGGVIDGLTISADEAALAAPHYRRVEVANLDSAELTALFPPGQYDAIVCADVLEHTRHPERVLHACRALLAPGGRVLLSIPNAGYCGLIAELMAGEFRYRPEGLLDETHLRFFTRQTLMRFLAENGWAACSVETVERALPDSEFRVAFDALPPAVARHLLGLPDALTYQFIVVARAAAPGETVAPPPEEAPALPAQALFTSQLYLGRQGGFDEARKLTQAGVIGASRQTLRFDLPSEGEVGPLTGLKLDPADRPGFLHLHAMALHAADGSVLWRWTPADAGLLAGSPHSGIVLQAPTPLADDACLLLLHGADPWLELPVATDALARAGGGHLEVTLGWPMSADYLALAGHVQAHVCQARQQAETARLAREEDQRHHEQERGAWQQQVESLSQTLQAQTQQNTQLREQRQNLLNQARTLTSERDDARRVLHAIENSTVFRATRPIVHAKMRLDRLLGTGSARPPAPQAATAQPLTPAGHPVDIIVPVYRGLEDTRRCIESVLASACRTPWRLIVINDASPEPAVTQYLREVAPTDARITLLENEENLGFVGTVNRGMALSAAHDVLLLNSDTEVASDWLDRIRAAAYSNQQVASVTPFSNNATICSYPRFCQDNDLPPGWDTARLDALFARVNAGQVVDVPTGVGFCMYIRRAALDAVGLFDVENFGKGYGEENDFCIRAQQAGWRNLHVLDTFVRHFGGVSFGTAKSPRERAAMETLRRLHPRYEGEVLRFVQADPARLARAAVDVARIAEGPRPVILAVLHDRQGGTERHVHELATALCGQAQFLALRPLPGQRVSLRLADLDEGFELVFALDGSGYDDLLTVLRQLGVGHIHFHHLLGHGEAVRQLPARLGVSYDFTAHDFYAICPQITLTDRHNRYCGEEGSVEAAADEGIDLTVWRQNNAALLNGARYVLGPGHDVLARLARFMPAAPLRHVPHTDIDPATPLPVPAPARLLGERPLKVAVIGALSAIKGADVLEDTAVAARQQGAPVEFHLIGYGYRALRTQPRANLTVHGRYDDDDLPALLRWLQPDVVWFPAQWPETYSYTLSACLQGGWPVVCPDLGAFAERLQGRPWSWVCPWDGTPAEWLRFFTGIRTRHFATGEPPPPVAAPTLTSAAVPPPPADARQWYASDYLAGVPALPASGPDRTLLSAHLPAPGEGSAAAGARGLALRLLVRLRSLPLLSGVARVIPLHWQTRVKNWLRR